MPGRQEARRKTPKKRVKFLMKTAVFEHPVKRYTIYWIFRNWRFHSVVKSGFLGPHFPLIRGMFVFRSGVRFLFGALEVPEPRVRKRRF